MRSNPGNCECVVIVVILILIIIIVIIIIIIIINIIIIGIIIDTPSKCWFDTIICQAFYLRPQTGSMLHYLGEILTHHYIIRDNSVFIYIESTFRNM